MKRLLAFVLWTFLSLVPAIAQVTSIPCNQLPALTGAVTSSAASCATTLGKGYPYFGGSGATQVTPGTTQYVFLAGLSSSEDAFFLSANNYTMRNFYVYTGDPAGSSQSYVVTFRISGADTGITCTINTGSTSCSDLTHTAAATAGGAMSVKIVSSASAAAQRVHWAIEAY